MKVWSMQLRQFTAVLQHFYDWLLTQTVHKQLLAGLFINPTKSTKL